MALIGGSIARHMMKGTMPTLARGGFTASAAARYYKALGYGIRWTDFLGMYRQAWGLERQRDPIKHVRKDRPPSARIMTPASDKLTSKYLYIYESTELNPLTGKPHFLSIGTEDHLTMGEAEDAFGLMVLERADVSEPARLDLDWQPAGVLRRRG